MHEISIYSFISIYLLLLVVIVMMKKANIHKTKELIFASVSMSVQLILAGFILTYLFANPYPALTLLYLVVMFSFATRQILSKKVILNRRFKWAVALSFVLSNCSILAFFVLIVTKQSLFNPQYTIPIAGMLVGNSMTGYNLALKTFQENLKNESDSVQCLLMLGVHPKKILLPHINKAFETAIIPTINSMVSMGIVFLPGMLTGQILAGASPNVAILYQITIIIAVCATVCTSVFCGLYTGQKFLYNEKMQFVFMT